MRDWDRRHSRIGANTRSSGYVPPPTGCSPGADATTSRRTAPPPTEATGIRAPGAAASRARPIGGIESMLSRKTAVAAAGAALATVPVAVAAAQDTPKPNPAPAAPVGVRAAGLAARAHANVLRDGALTQRAQRAHDELVSKNVKLARKVAHARDHKLAP